MSQNKAKKIAGRARKDARDEKQAKLVVNSIFAVLVALALAFLLYATVVMQ